MSTSRVKQAVGERCNGLSEPFVFFWDMRPSRARVVCGCAKTIECESPILVFEKRLRDYRIDQSGLLRLRVLP